jgi:hypothetical protein
MQAADAPVVTTTQAHRASAEDLADVYDGLVSHGFQKMDIQAAMEAVPHATLEAALDWLCMHVPPVRLPKRFEGVKEVDLPFQTSFMARYSSGSAVSLHAGAACERAP